jgi:hypothetical protein
MATGSSNIEVDVLAGLRELLRRLEYRELSMKQGNADVTSQETAALRQEIEQLERMLLHVSGQE